MSITRTRRIAAITVLAAIAGLLPASSAAAAAPTHQEVLHPNGAAHDQFGWSVDVDGDTMVVGAITDAVGGNQSQGSAHVYTRVGNSWLYQAELLHPNGAADDLFGYSVAIDGNTIVVGVPQDDVISFADGRGSAQVYTRTGNVWTHQAELLHPNGAASDNLGEAVGIEGDTIVVGVLRDDVGGKTDQGSAQVYTRTGTTWSHQAELIQPNGDEHDLLGWAVAISGNTVVAGAPSDTVGAAVDSGSAQVFTRSGTTWSHQAELLHPAGAADDFFGVKVAIDDDTVVVAAESDKVGANVAQGSAQVYVRSGTTWSHQAEILHPDGAAGDFFGDSVAIEGDTLVVGVDEDTVGGIPDQGSAQMYTRNGTIWTHETELLHPNGTLNDQFGIWVAISGGTIVVGDYDDDVAGNQDQGSAHVFMFDVTPPTIEALVSPPANAAGWHSQVPVTVSFVCDDDFGISSCSPSETIVNQTSGTTVTGTAIDSSGNTATTSVVVRIDTTAPTITINSSAATAHAGRSQKKAAAASSGVLRGTVNDTGAGIAGVTVTFRSRIQSPITRAATIAGSRWSVSLAGLPPRPLTAQATATDIAGNTTTTPAITLTDDAQPPTPPTTDPPASNPPGNSRTSDLAISRIRFPHTARLTNQLTVAYTITNRGPATTRGTKHAITIPQGLRLIAITTPGGIRCHPTLRNITCNTGTLRAGSSRTITLTLAAIQPGAQTLRITVTGPNRDPNTRNNTANMRTHVV